MVDLDCSSFESTLESTAAVLSVSPGSLLAQLRAFEVSALSDSEREKHVYAHLLVRHVTGFEPDDLPTPGRITWFHATRVPPSIDFSEGLLTLARVLGSIQECLTQLDKALPPKEQRKSRLRPSHGAGWKINSGSDEGPFAFLVREAIFRHQELMNVDYLRIPEIVDDFCDNDETLCAGYIAIAEPCIVVFQAVGMLRPDAVAAALNYLHFTERHESLSTECNACFNGQGRPVPREAIIRIERGEWLRVEYAAAQNRERNRS